MNKAERTPLKALRLGLAAAAIGVALHAPGVARGQAIERVDDVQPDKMNEWVQIEDRFCQRGETDGLEWAPANTFWLIDRLMHQETREVRYNRQRAQGQECQAVVFPQLQFGPVTVFEAPAAAVVPVVPAVPRPSEACPPAPQKLSVDGFVQLWRSTAADQPGPLIQKLDEVWDRFCGTIGGGSVVGNWIAPSGSLVWTNTQHASVLLESTRVMAPGDKWVPLRVEGGWGVYAAFDRVIVPTPGRFANTDRLVNPAELPR